MTDGNRLGAMRWPERHRNNGEAAHGIAEGKPACRVVWGEWIQSPFLPDSPRVVSYQPAFVRKLNIMSASFPISSST